MVSRLVITVVALGCAPSPATHHTVLPDRPASGTSPPEPPPPLAPPAPIPVVADLASEPSPDVILERATAVYTRATTYVDRGEDRSVFSSRRNRHTNVKPFKTAFVRDRGFRFEYLEDADPEQVYVIWSDGRRTLSQWWVYDNRIIEEHYGLHRAIGGAAGVSSGSSWRIPTLLSGESTLQDRFENVQLEGIDLIDHVRCWRLAGTYRSTKGRVTFWIEHERYVLRREESRSHHAASAKHEAFDVDSTMTLDAIVDVPVSPDLLREPSPKR